MSTTTETPTISIHMCTYNRAHFIKQAIDSVLSQTFTDFELLILDDASTDNTKEVILPYLTDPRIRYITNEHNLGITKNRNKALSLSRGTYIAVLDSDDYWIDIHKLQKQIDFIKTHSEYTLVGTYIHIVNNTNTIIKKISYPTSHFFIKQLLLIKNLFAHSSVMYRKDVVVSLGGYDESLAIWEDYDLWLKIGLTHKFANIQEYTTAYRKHSNQSNSYNIQIGKDAQKYIIEKYKKSYKGYICAKILNVLRNIKNNGK